MIHFVDNNGTIIKTIESPVYQGSAESNNIILIAPFAANLQFTVAFFLPNGEITPRYAMTQGGTLNGVEYAPTNGAMAIWTFSMPNNITQYFGTVYAQFYAYGTNGQITASSRTSFVVARGVPEELPDTPDQTIYNQILTALSQINTALNNGSYAARAIYWWINTYTYGMNEITFYPIGTYGAFVRSTVMGNTGNQPYTNDSVLDSEHWEELVNFNKIYAAEQNAIAQAQAAAESAQNAVESASAAAQSASSAAQSAQTAEKYAADAEEAGSKFSDLVNSGEIGNFVIQGKENKLTWSPNLWDYPNYLQVAKDIYVSETLSSGVRISYESIEVFRSDGDRFTSYEIGQIRDVSEKSYNRTFALPSQSGTLALTSDVAAESSAREQADNALQSDIDGIQQQLSETQHFRGYYETTAQVQSISNPHSGDYAWNAQTGTVWNYSTAWSDSGVAIPDQTVQKSSTTPLMDGTATLGSTNTYADGGHRHPTDTTRASVTALNSEMKTRSAADNNLQSQIDDIKDGTTVVGRASADANGNNIPDTYAKQNGTYRNFIAGGVDNVGIDSTTNINDYYGADYWGKEYYFGGGNNPQGSPEGISGGHLSVIRAGSSTTIQVIRTGVGSDSSGLPTTYQRDWNGSVWTDWEELVTADGRYLTLGAGYLAKELTVSNGANTNRYYKLCTFTSPKIAISNSFIFLINGIYGDQPTLYAAESGVLEWDIRSDSNGGVAAASSGISILGGNLSTSDFFFVISEDLSTISLCCYLTQQYGSLKITELSNSNLNYDVVFDGTAYTSAPANAVYAVNRNLARPLFITQSIMNKTPTLNTDILIDVAIIPSGIQIGDNVLFYCYDGNETYACTGTVKSISSGIPTVTITGITPAIYTTMGGGSDIYEYSFAAEVSGNGNVFITLYSSVNHQLGQNVTMSDFLTELGYEGGEYISATGYTDMGNGNYRGFGTVLQAYVFDDNSTLSIRVVLGGSVAILDNDKQLTGFRTQQAQYTINDTLNEYNIHKRKV